MAIFLNEAAAASEGFHIEHEPERSRFALYRSDARDEASSNDASHNTLVGEAHYSLRGDNTIDFDHTVVDPAYRGTGLSGLLAHHALTSSVTHNRKVVASCWYIDGYLAKHPELLD